GYGGGVTGRPGLYMGLTTNPIPVADPWFTTRNKRTLWSWRGTLETQPRRIFRVSRRFDRIAAQPASDKNDGKFCFRVARLRDDCPQTFSVRRRYEIVNNIDIRVIFAWGPCFAWKFFRTKRRRNENKRDCRSELHFAPAALTTFCAASARSSAGISSTPLFFKSCFPFSTFVPSSLTTTGTESFTVFAA